MKQSGQHLATPYQNLENPSSFEFKKKRSRKHTALSPTTTHSSQFPHLHSFDQPSISDPLTTHSSISPAVQVQVLPCQILLFFNGSLINTYLMSRTAKAQPAQPAKPAAQQSWKDRLTTEDYEELKSTFEVFDEDGSGTIDPSEINKVLEELGLDKRNPFILSLIHALRDQNKPVSFEEFLGIVGSKVGETKTKDGLRRVFSLYDKDQNGSIDFEEFKAISKQLHENLNDDDLLEMLHSTHVNQKTATSQSIEFQEFYRIVSKWANK